ncbi:23S rRNA (adenine(2503)-C(2))-methyltransferase RlmN [Candidatus Endomicrobiellum trichonymphae]|uniref:Probable dual-specificity RNA methyltransferase RlmN n=1 Tax=Endomicrobium trichonymphae TaxID=1408204 RepID=RLMN_ENDTX|nr:23S rRNA (adenine(2503)-C(2))-methyltransferase RlmN [Candidatus Endomicrobium trichonymphae]B1H070.1 RecName: Full=Probable dual-specificity RNA methyltransferase RlmN; AltName: Full=23S rRNA (adenine(2503)-C(2))-methyltransferase; AltName: Full=23S rRNA m2A2503 methyltransferase; AltName: Full=Ribosomal RNA large subunit methyltransferase N; AltName: Full=tRNA (adenine(37)-C(2))-methyltransferase; AltName: Full=tRNA m2A37 methyltransferase [Candidatus Endomicrobium trichonymphae]BAG13902.1 2
MQLLKQNYKKYILDLNDAQFNRAVKPIIEQDYRINQIIEWIYAKKAVSFESFTNIPKELRNKLDEKFFLRTLKIVKKEKSLIDSTIRYTFRTADKKYFFAVFLPANGKNSVCISSQIGCPIMCAFCSSGKTKLARNLSRGEIIEQILQVENDTKEKISGILFMGMGEPMLNFNNLISVLNSLLSSKEFGIGKRHITVSSVGIVPAVKKLADDNFGVRLALSLHAVDERQRKKLVPDNLGFSIEDILKAGKYYLKKTNSHLTIEYVLVKGINISSADAHKLARLLKRCDLINSDVQVNLIPFNPVTDVQFQRPDKKSINKFKSILKLNGITVNVRQSKGANINAACGQLGY